MFDDLGIGGLIVFKDDEAWVEIRYTHMLGEGKHLLRIQNDDSSRDCDVELDTPGEIINYLVPYREKSHEVRLLIRWLANQARLPVLSG